MRNGNRWLHPGRILAIGVTALTLPLAPVFAQAASQAPSSGAMQGQASSKMEAQDQAAAPSGSFDSKASATGVVQGLVQNVNWQSGLLTMISGANRITLHGTPSQLSTLKRGDNISVPYNSYAGVLWVTQDFGAGIGTGGSGAGFAQSGEMVGVVDAVNKAEGQVFITGANGRARFLAHPSVIDQLVPGEYVNLSYFQVGRMPWLNSIKLSTPGQAAETK